MLRVHTRFLAWLVTAITAGILATAAFGQSDLYYEIDELNRGLGEPPDYVDRTTPRDTIESLLRLAERDDWSAAAHLLDLGDIPVEQQQVFGPLAAEQLVMIIDRKVVLDWNQLNDRPDGLDATASSNSATAGMTRRSLLLWDLKGERVPIALRLNRVKPAGEDPVWVFSRQFVPSIPMLHDLYGPSALENLLPEAWREDAFWGLKWWEFVALPLLALTAGMVGYFAFRAVRRARYAFRNPTARSAIKAAATPIVVAAVTLVVWWATSRIFVFSGKLDVVISPLIALGFVTAILMLIFNIVEAILSTIVNFDEVELSSRQSLSKRQTATRLAAVRRLLTVAVFIIGAGVVLSTADVFRTLGFSLLASAGAVTLVLGFAARKVLGNIMSSLQIALNGSARIGDRVVFKEHLCHVERINFTYVQLRDWDGTRLVVPVEEFVSESFENWTLQEPEMLRILKFKLNPSVDIDDLRDALQDILETIDEEELGDREQASVKVTGQDVFGIDVWFAVPCSDPNTSWDVSCEVREKLVTRLSEMERDGDRKVFPDATPAEAA